MQSHTLQVRFRNFRISCTCVFHATLLGKLSCHHFHLLHVFIVHIVHGLLVLLVSLIDFQFF